MNMTVQKQEINSEVQDYIFEELTEMFDYWGENKLRDMIDFCNRNQLHSQKKTLTILLRPDITKTSK